MFYKNTFSKMLIVFDLFKFLAILYILVNFWRAVSLLFDSIHCICLKLNLRKHLFSKYVFVFQLFTISFILLNVKKNAIRRGQTLEKLIKILNFFLLFDSQIRSMWRGASSIEKYRLCAFWNTSKWGQKSSSPGDKFFKLNRFCWNSFIICKIEKKIDSIKRWYFLFSADIHS